MLRHAQMVCLLSVVLCRTSSAQQNHPGPDEEPIHAALRNYVEVFNQNDAAAVAALWAENAVYVDRENGERLEGRAALQQDFETMFIEHSAIRLSGELQSVSFVTENVAMAEGTAIVFVGDADPATTGFSATFVREDDRWLLHSVNESELPLPESPYDALQPLSWMLGDWVDESDEMRVDTSVNWAPGGAFLIRSYLVQDSEGPVREGTQVIGWDPRSHEIRSWSFNSDGSFGDGVWTQSSDHWSVQSTQTLADGSAASGTYIVTPVDDDSMTIQLIGHEIAGSPQPASDVVTIVRDAAAGNNGDATGGAE